LPMTFGYQAKPPPPEAYEAVPLLITGVKG
jgi:hypothetical protein